MNENGVQRRLSAILAADVVGYTRLMEQDTDGTVAAWQAANTGTWALARALTRFRGVHQTGHVAVGMPVLVHQLMSIANFIETERP